MEFEDEEYKQFLQDLQQYPNYFQMETQNCSSHFWRRIAQKIEDEKEEEQEEDLKLSDLVRIKNQNLEACASYNLGDVDKAEKIISKVLEDTNSSSINACAMMAILNYRNFEITKARKHLSRIKELAADPYNIDVAKSELAYAYTRLKPIFYKKAIALYTEAVERNPNNFPWKYDLAVIYRRCMTTTIQAMFPDLQLETCFNEAKKHLTYVLENCTDEKDRFFKARSYIELADLYSVANTTDIIFTDKNNIIDLVNQGVQSLPNNHTILRKAGRILRHCFKVVEAEELLQKAYDIRPNSYICHQLGLIKKNNIIHQHRQSKLYPTGDQRYGNKCNQAFDSPHPKYATPQDKELELNVPIINVSKQVLTEPKPILKPDEDIKPSLKPDEDTKPILKPDEDIKPSLKPDEDIKPSLKPDEDIKPSLKPDEDTKPILKPDEDTKPILKPDEDTKPILKPDEDTKPILKPDEDIKPILKPDEDSKPILKPDEDIKPILKPDEDIKPRLKPDVDTKPILKPDEDITNPTVCDNDLEEDLTIAEPVNQHSFPHVSPYQTTLKQLDPVQLGSTLLDNPSCPIGSPDPFYPKSCTDFDKGVKDDDLDSRRNPSKDQQFAVKVSDDPRKTMATGGPTIPNESEKELAERLSKVSLTDTAESGKEPVKVKESSTPPPVSSWQTSTIEKSGLQNQPVVTMTKLINSPKKETYDMELSRKLDPCLDLFRESAKLGQEQNLAVYYDWGITLLQMIPTKFKEVIEKFNHILAKDRSQLMRYRCYEQYGICKLRMSESQDFDEKLRQIYREDAKDMFRNAIRCWADCQKINLGKHFDDAEGNCNSLGSIREIILGEVSGHGTKPKRDMASLYYLVKQYGSSLSLYQEVYDELQHTSDTTMDSDVIKGIVRNNLQLKQHTGVLDLLALLLCSKEGLQCLEFKTDVLTQMMHYSIDTNDNNLSESVFNFEKDPNEDIDNDVTIIFNEEDQVSKKIGATLQKWLHTFSKSGLKVIKITETAPNLPRHQEQINLICNSKIAIFILANDTPSTELTYFMNIASKARLDNNYFLKKIFPIVINDGMVPDIIKIFRSIKITHQPNILEEQDKSAFLKAFSDVFFGKTT